MSLFPRTFISNDPTSFHPLFRLLDDFDTYSKSTTPNSLAQRDSNIMKTFNPKFDVKELPSTYELHGELPGIEQSDIEIEFSDPQTLVIRGHVERSYTAGTPPDEEGSEPSSKPARSSTAAAVVPKEGEAAEPQEKYWVSERSEGDFSRAFTFPIRVDADAVKASMKNGILSIVVPKAKKEHVRKITIS